MPFTWYLGRETNTKMITLEKCKQILNTKTKKFSDEEIKLIREYLYIVANIETENINLKNK